MGLMVMEVAQQDAVLNVGGASQDPGEQVVSLAIAGREAASWRSAAPVPRHEGAALCRSEEASRAPQAQWLVVGVGGQELNLAVADDAGKGPDGDHTTGLWEPRTVLERRIWSGGFIGVPRVQGGICG